MRYKQFLHVYVQLRYSMHQVCGKLQGIAVRALLKQMHNLLFIIDLFIVTAVPSLYFKIIPYALFVWTMKGWSLCLCKNVLLEKSYSWPINLRTSSTFHLTELPSLPNCVGMIGILNRNAQDYTCIRSSQQKIYVTKARI